MRSVSRDAGAEPHAESHSLSRLAYERIRSALAAGQLLPNEVIRESDLAREYGISRTPIREALHRLHGEGLIRPAALGGFVAIELGAKELTDIYQVREALAALSVQLAAANRTRVDLARLEDALEAFDRAFAENRADEGDESVRAYWRAIAAASGNDYLRDVFVRATDLFRYKGLAASHPEWRAMLIAKHREVLEALRRRDAAHAERSAREIFSRVLAIRISELHAGDAPGG